MAKDDFALSLRSAYGVVAPAATGDGPAPEEEALERALFGASSWLSAKAVEGFDIEDFPTLGPGQRRELQAAVEAFRDLAGQIPTPGRPSLDQRRRGWESFETIHNLVKADIRDEWLHRVDALLEQAKLWCDRAGWIASLKGFRLRDKFLGDYEARKLLFVTGDFHYSLEPVARYAGSSSGLVDLAILPAYESVRITRSGAHWLISKVLGDGRPSRWSEGAFRAAVADLVPYA